MHIYISGIGGCGMGSLALMALEIGENVTGSDLNKNSYTKAVQEAGGVVHLSQDGELLREVNDQKKIDWFVYTAALKDDHPELVLARELGLKVCKRDELINKFLDKYDLSLVSVAGTHGKTTTTSMVLWVFEKLGISKSHIVGGVPTFIRSGGHEDQAKYFVYEADEFDKNFLHFHSDFALISSIEHDHITTYPTDESYKEAFEQFISQSKKTYMWKDDYNKLKMESSKISLLDSVNDRLTLYGKHNRENAQLVLSFMEDNFKDVAINDVVDILNDFPGVARRFERLAENLYSDYAHHPDEVKATMQRASEEFDNVVAVYQPHQHKRQRVVKDMYSGVFDKAKKVYWMPVHESREIDGKRFSPEELQKYLSQSEQAKTETGDYGTLREILKQHIKDGDCVVGMSAGSLDGWLRENLQLTS